MLSAFAKNIGGLIGAGTTVVLARLESLTDGKVKMESVGIKFGRGLF